MCYQLNYLAIADDGTIFVSDTFSLEIIDADSSAEVAVYFSYIEANFDGVDRVRLLGDNSWGFEDLPQGGDMDFNDIVIQASFN